MKTLNESSLRKVPLEELTRPRTGHCTAYVDYFWIVTDDEELLFYEPGARRKRYGAPQANPNQGISERIKEIFPMAVSVRQIPAVFVPLSMGDYT